METIEKIKQLETELANLKAQVESEIVSESEEFKRERVEKYKSYYFLNSENESVDTEEDNDFYDDRRFKYFNYFKTKEEAERVRDYRLKTALFVEAALFYAQEYEFQRGKENWFVSYDAEEECFHTNCSFCFRHITQIHMNKEQVEKFCDWCNKHKEELI
jgi:hypothetical protein